MAFESGKEQAVTAHMITEQTIFSVIFSTTSSNGSAQFNSFQLSN